MRFVEALERVLDPRLAIIDCRTAYFTPGLAPAGMSGSDSPPAMVEVLASWLGIDARTLPPVAARELLANASELARTRGTKAGIELALRCRFVEEGLHLAVHDGGATVAGSARAPQRPGTPGLRVCFREKLTAEQRAAATEIVEAQRPLLVSFPGIEEEDQSVPLKATR
jgi:phage tail-like protein